MLLSIVSEFDSDSDVEALDSGLMGFRSVCRVSKGIDKVWRYRHMSYLLGFVDLKKGRTWSLKSTKLFLFI